MSKVNKSHIAEKFVQEQVVRSKLIGASEGESNKRVNDMIDCF